MHRLLASVLTISSAAFAQSTDGGLAFDAGCDVVATTEDQQVHVACSDGRLRTFTPTASGLSLSEERVVQGQPRGLFSHGGKLWVEYARVEARPVSELTAGAPASMATVSPPPAPNIATAVGPPASTRVFTVLEVQGPNVIVSMGSDDGLRGDGTVELGPLQDSLDGVTPLAAVVGVATDVSPHKALVRVGFGELVRVGDPARLSTRAPTGSSLAPQRAAGVVATGASARLMVPLGALGFGTFADAFLTWHTPTLVALTARVGPSGGLGSSSGSGGTFAGSLEASFDSQYFALGLGLGVRAHSTFDFSTTSQLPVQRTAYGFSPNLLLRVGAIDGLHFVARQYLIALDQRLEFAGLEGQAQIPLNRTWWLVLRGGGSTSQLYWGELGMRIAVKGNGGPGTLFLTPTLGGLAFTTERYTQAGPTAGLGFEYRSGP